MSALLVKRPPWGSAILLPAIIALAARSMVCRDALEWTGVDADDADSAAIVTSGVATSRLGVSFVRRQELLHPTDRNASSAAARAVEAAPLGMRWNTQPLPEHPTLLRRLGIGWEREVHDERASYRDRFELTLPLWLLAGVFAISPAHFLLARRRERATAARADRASDAPVANIAIAGRPPMKYGLPIGIACGVVVGAIAMSLLVPRAKPPASDGAAGSAPQATARRKRPIHPIVGTWRAFIDVGIAAIYRFDNDGTFALTIKPLPRLGISGPATHEAAGTWKVAGNALSMINTSSNTPISVVGESETATIDSVDAESLVIDTTDRKGDAETLRFERVEPFVAGRYDNPILLGKWQSASDEMELRPSGEVVMTRAAWKGGKWSQHGRRLRFVLDPPYVRSAARRMADPSLATPLEQEYVVRLSADNETLTLTRVGIPNYPVQQFRRMPEAQP